LISTIEGIASRAWPKNSRQTVRVCLGILCSIQRAEVIRPSQPSFCTPGRPARNLSVTSLPRPSLRKRPEISRISVLKTSVFWPFRRVRPLQLEARHFHVVDLAQVVVQAGDFQPVAFGSTMRQLARLSSAVPHSTAFLPPAFMAMLPPMQEASAEVGSTANTKPAFSAASETRLVTTPAPV
jgi:hypothetical protein